MAQWIFAMDGTTARAGGNECWVWTPAPAAKSGIVRGCELKGWWEMPRRGPTAAWHRWATASFMVADNAHILALNRFTGDLVWQTEMADWTQNYNATSAPLIADGLVISGTAGGEHGALGFVAAYDPETGKEAWRFCTVPKPVWRSIREPAV